MLIGNAFVDLGAEFLYICVINFLVGGAEFLQNRSDLRPCERRLVDGVGQIGLQCVCHFERSRRVAGIHTVDVSAEGRNLSQRSADAIVGVREIVDLLGVCGVLTNNSRLVYLVGVTEQSGVEIQVAGLIAFGVGLEQVCLTGVRLGGEQDAVLGALFHLALSALGNIEEKDVSARLFRHHTGGGSLP